MNHLANYQLNKIHTPGFGGGAGAQQDRGVPDPGEGQLQAQDRRDPDERAQQQITHSLHCHRAHEGGHLGTFE